MTIHMTARIDRPGRIDETTRCSGPVRKKPIVMIFSAFVSVDPDSRLRTNALACRACRGAAVSTGWRWRTPRSRNTCQAEMAQAPSPREDQDLASVACAHR
jgi:hypothetical protein